MTTTKHSCIECGRLCLARYQRCHVCAKQITQGVNHPRAQPDQWRSSWRLDEFGNKVRQIASEAPPSDEVV